jgi:PAS domain S-box-containing protein
MNGQGSGQGSSQGMDGQGSGTAGTATADFDAFAAIDQRALDCIPTGFCVCRTDSSLVRYNGRATEIWGATPQLGDPKEQYSPRFRRFDAEGAPLDFDATPVARAMRSGERIVGAEIIIERPDGLRIPVLMNVQPLQDAAGKVIGAVCSFQELTERKRVEEALRASEAELQSVINRTPFMLVRCSRDLRYRFMSEAYAQMIDQPRELVIGETIADMLGAKGYETLRPYIEKVLEGEAVDFKCAIEFPRIGLRSLDIAYRPEFDAQGKVGGWIASLRDITGEQAGEQAQRQLASIVESSDDAIISKNLNGVIVSWNPGARRLFGYAAEEVVGRPITVIIPAELKDEEPKILARIRRGERIEHYETVRRRKDGSLVDVSLTVSPMRDATGRVVGASKIARDITARKRADAAIRHRADEQAALYQFTDRLYRARTLDDIYQAALDAIVAALHCSRASILRCEADGAMRFAAWRGLSDRYRGAVDGHSPWHAGESNPDPLCIGDVATAGFDETIAAAVKGEGIGALAFIPLMAEGKLVGKFMAYYDGPRSFGREDIDLALTLARQLGFAIERMRAEQARGKIEAELRSLSERLEA